MTRFLAEIAIDRWPVRRTTTMLRSDRLPPSH